MRVTHVITRLIVGGAQENTIASVLGLQGRPGLEVDLISGPTGGPEGSLESAFDTHPALLTRVPSLIRAVHPWHDARALFALTAVFRRTHPEIVHTHSGKAGILGRFAAHRAGVPLIVHGIHGPSFGPFQGPIANAIFTTAERRAGRITTHFVTVANAMRDQYLAAGIGRAHDYTRIFSGFPLEPFLNARNDLTMRERFGIAPGDFVVGKIARLFQLKGHDDLFDAAPQIVARCPQVKFLLVGGGEWEERFRQRAGQLGLRDHFVFTGLVPPAQVPALVGIMNVLVHLSRREGLARALPQALAAGCPVVAYDCDGAREACLENETGFLIRPGDLGSLASRLVQLAGDRSLRQRLGLQGQTFARDRFSVERMVAELEALYWRLGAERLGLRPHSTKYGSAPA